MTDAHTRLGVVLGHPVAHSKSPAMFSAAFAATKLNAQYLAWDVTPEQLPLALHTLAAVRALGASVTVPHKLAVVAALTWASPRVHALQCANCVRFSDGVIQGDNTDVDGFVATVKLWRGWQKKRTRPVVLLGAGGAARAVAFALHELGFKEVQVVNRGAARRDELTAWARDLGLNAVSVGWEHLPSVLTDAALVVNATSAEVRGEPVSVPFGRVPAGSGFIDLSYGPKLPLLRAAKQAKLWAVDGEEMLIQQAARAFTWWTQKKAPVAALRRGYRR